jgi:hypothetical protein
MRSILFGAVFILSVATATAAPMSNPMDAVDQFVGGMNHNDMKSAAAAYAPNTSIIDEFPPYHWQGQTAFADWERDFGADSKKNAITDPIVTLGKPLTSSVNGDKAYLVIPATYSFKQNGKPMREEGSIMTFAMQKTAEGWRIAAWSWSAREAPH